MSTRESHSRMLRHSWSKNKEKRVEAAMKEAELAFWAVIAEKFPEIKTGDCTPESVSYQQDMLLSFVREWVKNNEYSIEW